MGLFDSVRGFLGDEESADASDELSAGSTDEIPRLDVRDPDPMDFRNKAVDAVQEWDACDLDFSLDSLERLDSFARKQGARLDVLRDESDDGGERVADMHTGFTIRAGSYVGEVLVRELDGEWVETDEHWAVRVPTGDDATTVDVFEVASHSFAQEPVFADLADNLDAGSGADDDETAEADEVDLRPKFRPDAEEFAAFWDAYDLDFSAVSLARLDVLVESEWDDDEFSDVEAGGDDMDSKMYTELVKQLGCYYGEVLVRELDAGWTRRNGAVVVVVPGGEDAAVTVPVFDVAEAALTGRAEFAVDVTTVAEEAGLEAPAVPTRAPTEPDPDEPLDVTPNEEPTADETSSDASEAEASETDGTAPEGTATDTDRTASPGSLSPAEIVGMDATAASPSDEEATEDTGPAESGGADAAPFESDSDGDEEATTESEEAPDVAASSTDDEGSAVGVAADSEQDDAAPEPDDDELVDSLIGGSQTSDDATADSTTPNASETAASMDDAIPRAEPSATPSESTTDSDGDDSAPEELDLEDGTQAGDGGLTPEDIREDAAAFAATWPGHDLDFSPESLARLDALVAEEYPADDVPDVDLSDANATDAGYLAARVVEAGGYFAEVLRRTVGGRWRDDEAGLVFVVSGQTGEVSVDPAAVATECFRGEDSFEARYAAIRSQLSPSG